jgi:hypothetical protein
MRYLLCVLFTLVLIGCEPNEVQKGCGAYTATAQTQMWWRYGYEDGIQGRVICCPAGLSQSLVNCYLAGYEQGKNNKGK